MNTANKTIYMALSADYIHAGHINILKKAREYGEVIIGVLTDAAICEYKNAPITSFDQRLDVARNLSGIAQVIPQTSSSMRENLEKLRPDFVIHGDDWKKGPGNKIRLEVLELLAHWNGELIEVPYTKGLSSSFIKDTIVRNGITPSDRLTSLKRLMEIKPLLRILEVHNGLCGLIAETASYESNESFKTFDGVWESSLTDSTSKGKPDTQAVDFTSRIQTIEQVLEVTTRPMIVDGDNGGLPEHFYFLVRTLERLGVSAVIIEDKIGPKRNSLFGTEKPQFQDNIADFCFKIKTGKRAQITPDFMIIARIESLIAGAGQEDAMERARNYVQAGADGIMIHSNSKSPQEILEFAKQFRVEFPTTPLICVPSTYGSITEKELEEAGFKIVIYANQLLRAAFPAMMSVARTILKTGRCLEADQQCMPIKEIISLIPEDS